MRHFAWIFALLGLTGTIRAETLVYSVGNPANAEDKLYLANDDGSSASVVASGSSYLNVPGRVTVDRVNRRIYVCDQTSAGGGVFRFDADGSNKTTIFTNSTSGSQVLGVAVDGTHGKLYIAVGNATAAEDKLYSAGLDGSGAAVIVSGASFTGVPNTIAVDPVNQRVYVCDQTTSGGGVFRFDSDGSNKTTIYTNSISGSQVQGISIDSSRSYVYFITGNASAAEDKLLRCGLDGSSLTTLVSGASLTSVPGQVAVDPTANRIYVADSTTSSGGVFRFDADGSNRTTVHTNSVTSSQVLGLAMLPPTGTTVASLVRVVSSPTNAGTVNWTLTFGSATTGVTAANFSLSGTATSGATVGTPTTSNSGLTWNIPVTTGSGDGTLQLDLANATGLGQSISTSLPYAGQAYTMDKTAPAVVIGSPSSAVSIGGNVSYTVTYSDANFSGASLVVGNVTLNSTGTASGSVGVAGSGTTRTVTISSITGVGTLGISLAAGTAADTAGNTASAAGPSTTFSVDTVPPQVSSIVRLTPTTQHIGDVTVVFRVTFSEPVQGVTTDSFTVSAVGGSSITGTVTAVSGSGTTYDVTVTITGGTGEFTVVPVAPPA